MERFYSSLKRQKPPSNDPPNHVSPSTNLGTSSIHSNIPPIPIPHPELQLDEILANLPADPGLRPPMKSYNPNFRESIRRAYIQKGPCQPQIDMPQTFISDGFRRFQIKWYDQFTWLEYNEEKDAAFCFCCYLFKCDFDKHGTIGNDVFTEKGFKNWKKGQDKCEAHHVETLHKEALQRCSNLTRQKQHIETIMIKHTTQAQINYRTMLTAALDVTRFLLRQGIAFRGHDESKGSSNRGNYLELMQFLADHNESVRNVVLENAPQNLKYIAHAIQKQLVNSCAVETINAIANDMAGAFFSILVDEARDVSVTEQMAVVLRYVNKTGKVMERFVGVQHVTDTTSSMLKSAIENLMSSKNLSMSKLRGQGYDGASNMRGELNGLKTKMLSEYPQAYYVHCFAHQLQLALVAVAKGNDDVAAFFASCNSLVNIIGASCKRRDKLREKSQIEFLNALADENYKTGKGLHQETSLQRPCETRWSSHYNTLLRIKQMFQPVVEVLEWIVDDDNHDNKGDARRLVKELHTFDFVFHLFLMNLVLGVTHELSQALQRKNQDIVNAMAMINACKRRLQGFRDDDFIEMLHQVMSFCEKYGIFIPNMEDQFFPQGKSHRRARIITNLHYYRVELFLHVIDKQLAELNDRFNEGNTKLLLSMACLSPNSDFAAFDIPRIIRFAQFYPRDFDERSLVRLEDQLPIYIMDVRADNAFSSLEGISALAEQLVSNGKSENYKFVYKLITLALVLPVATASVERAFSAMNILKPPLRNKMGDEWLSDSLVVYIERDVFACIDNEKIMQRFHGMTNRRQLLIPK